MVSKKILRVGAQKTTIQKTYKINIGTDSINIDLLESNRQFDWVELSLSVVIIIILSVTKATNIQQ